MDFAAQHSHPLDMTNAFAFDTMTRRIPGIIRSVQAANADYPPAIHHALDRLHAALIQNEPITLPGSDAVPVPGDEDWAALYQAQQQKIHPLTWQHNEWFFAETFLYRHFMQAVRWFETGRDPFISYKQAELDGDRLWPLLAAALEIDGDSENSLGALLSLNLWGNRVDLSHPAGTLAVQSAAEDELLVDDRARVVEHLVSGENPGAIHLIADNAGTELAIDLVLIDRLLRTPDQAVVLHVKFHPTFMSDTTPPDVWTLLDAMEAHDPRSAALAQRLRLAWQHARLHVVGHPFWNSGHFLWEMPPSLHRAFTQARLVILKGDVNYRRAIGDTIWDPAVTFAQVMDYFPAPVLALRSSKCDSLVGVPREKTDPLDAVDNTWRSSGRYGLIQFASKAG